MNEVGSALHRRKHNALLTIEDELKDSCERDGACEVLSVAAKMCPPC